MLQKKARENKSGVGRLVLAVILIVLAVFVFVQRQTIADYISFWQYEPTAEMSSLASRASMNEQGKLYFYASKPELLEAKVFNSVCADHDPEGATLGCYRGGLIYIYDIDDERLDGIREVTAAHEMLHAAYARLSSQERTEINRLIDEAFDKLQDDKLSGRLEMYERNQPGTRYVELHAIIGTEFRDIAPNLETHYSEVFEDRLAVVDLYESYISQFTQREERAAAIEQDLKELSSTIELESGRYSRDVQSLSDGIENFNSRAGSVNSQLEYDNLTVERRNLMSRTSELENRRAQIEASINRYNQLVEEYNGIATEVRNLTESLDSNLAPTPSV